jgi:hypothetical protein
MEQNIAHTTAHQQRLMAMALERFANRIGEFPWSQEVDYAPEIESKRYLWDSGNAGKLLAAKDK